MLDWIRRLIWGAPRVFGEPLFIFAIPLKPRRVSKDWEMVQEHLRQTLRSILASTNGNFLVVIACHDIPDLRDIPREKIRIVRVFYPIRKRTAQDRHGDKTRKRRRLGAWIRRNIEAPRYYIMFLDADDLIDRSLVDYVLKDGSLGGYLVEKGYKYDAGRKMLFIQKNFHKGCGSCFIGSFVAEDLPCGGFDQKAYFSRFKGHKTFREVAASRGQELTTVPFPAVVYWVNHGESLMLYRRSGKPRRVNAAEVNEVDAPAILKDHFAFEEGT